MPNGIFTAQLHRDEYQPFLRRKAFMNKISSLFYKLGLLPTRSRQAAIQYERITGDFEDHPPDAQGKNLLWFVLDCLRPEVFEAWWARGGGSLLHPEALFLQKTYAQGSWTYPSFFSFLSGLYPFNTGASTVSEEDGLAVSHIGDFDHNLVTIFDLLREQGYNILSYNEYWNITLSGAAKQNFAGEYFVERWGQYNSGKKIHRTPGETADTILSQIREAISQENPFFHFARLLFTHPKSDYGGQFTDFYELIDLILQGREQEVLERMVRNVCAFEDVLLRPMLKMLQSAGMLDNTVIILTSDHGDTLWDVEPDMRRAYRAGEWHLGIWNHCLEPYHALMRVPLLVWGAGPRGVWVEPFRLVDLVPSVLKWLEVPYKPQQFDGIAFGEPGPRPLYCDSANYHGLGGVALVENGIKYFGSRRMGAVSYEDAVDKPERIELRRKAPEATFKILDFVRRHERVQGQMLTEEEEQQVLEQRLRDFGYID
jgi:hypothetical protein